MAELTPAAVAALLVVHLFLLISAVRIALAVAVLRRREPTGAPADVAGEPVTVLQAILSGDPTMAGHLRENLSNHPDARFVWLIDEDDPEGRRIGADLAATAPDQVTVVLTPPPPADRNPKVFKLCRGMPHCGALVAVLDDDTVLPPGALERARRALSCGDLVTGLPVYRRGGTVFSRLVAAFVNSSALVTYLPMVVCGAPVTINGMFSLTRRRVLDELGGFEAIEDRLCDDYELAKLYRRAGRRIVQTTITHPLATTVPDLRCYLRLLRRWMVFATHLLRDALNPPMTLLVVLPVPLPLVAVVLAVVSGSPPVLGAVAAALVLKASAMAGLRRWAADTREGPGTILAEVVADLLLPVNVATAAIRPARIVWRTRAIRTDRGGMVQQVAQPEAAQSEGGRPG